jgi:hypothetical protein
METACMLIAGALFAGQAEAGPLLSTGNLSVDYIQHSPVGCSPNPEYVPQIPSVEELISLREKGLWGYEDYIAWGAVEREEGVWDWSHHLEVRRRVEEAGLAYIPYIWCHYPPVWLRDDERVTLMRCNNGGVECFMLSIYDPRTLGWYRRFYEALRKAFGTDLPEVYACLLGPYAEGNYPLPYANFVVAVGDCPDGQYWCADEHALPAFQKAMAAAYDDVAALNEAWGTDYAEFDALAFPACIATGEVPDFSAAAPAERRRWLDFIHWYHQALIDFSRGSIDIVADLFGRERTAAKPGGNCGWMNPLPWGTYNPGYAKMAAEAGVALQSADSRGAYWADKWTSTAYAHYGVPYRTEAAGSLDERAFALRTFTDISCGASRLFSYELDRHMTAAVRSLPLFTGERGMTRTALLAPTTLYYLHHDVMPLISMGGGLRDLFDYDVCDELLVNDGALKRYDTLIVLGCHVIAENTADTIRAWAKNGGRLVWVSDIAPETVGGEPLAWLGGGDFEPGRGHVHRRAAMDPATERLCAELAAEGNGVADGIRDGVWTTRRADGTLLINTGEKPVERTVPGTAPPRAATLPPFEVMWFPDAAAE